MMGKKRAGKGSNKDYNPQVGIHQLGTICRELKRSCPPFAWPVVKNRFIYYNKNELDSYPALPWFLPEWLGGIGLPMDRPDEVSRLDRIAASIIKQNLGLRRPLRLLKPVVPKDAAMWLMHKRVMANLRNFSLDLGTPSFKKGFFPPTEMIFDLQDEYARFYKMATIDLLYTLPLKDLFEIVEEDRNLEKSLWHNVNVFREARLCVEKSNLDPMSDEDMIYENKDLVLPCCAYSFEGMSFGHLGMADLSL